MQYDPDLLESIKNNLINKGETLAVSESVTSGNIQAALSQAKDAAKFFQGGITVYNLGQKFKHLNVEPIHAETCLCVSSKVAEEMAINTCRLFQSDYGTGITGFATPLPEKGINKLYAFFAIAKGKEILISERISAPEMESEKVQIYYTEHLLTRLAQITDMENKKDNSKKESAESLREESVKSNEVKKGYNEKNPSQPQGAFPPDSKTGKQSPSPEK